MSAAKAQRPKPSDRITQIASPDLEAKISPIEIVMGKGLFDHVLRGIPAYGLGQQGENRGH